MTSHRTPRSAIVAALFLSAVFSPCGAQSVNNVENLFPPEFRTENYAVKRTPLEPEKRTYLEGLGVRPEVIDLYGDIHVTGYHSDHLRWGDVRPDDFGRDEVSFLNGTMREFAPLAEGAYPRLFFSDDDREWHLHRLENTEGGRIAREIIQRASDALRGKRQETGYENYAAGKPEGSFNVKQLPYEAFRCWVYQDDEGAKKAATAFATYLRHEVETTANQLHPRHPNGFDRPNVTFYPAICYDLLHNAMTPEQRELARSILYLNHYNNNQYGCFQAAEGTASNWASFSYRLMSWLPLDGHRHFNTLQYLGYVRGMRNFLTYGWFPEGTCYEGMGKNRLGGPILFALARRGENLAEHPHVLAHVRDYLPHAIVPWGGRYVAYDLLGGVDRLVHDDILPLKALYPDDPRIDWVYRNSVGEDFEGVQGKVPAASYWDTTITSALFLQDPLEGNDDPSAFGLPESFFGGQRGLMITRSDWGKEAAYLHHHCRAACGGHTFMDRNSIIYGDKGRMWITFEGTRARVHDNSQVRIDDWRPGSSMIPGKMIDYLRTDLATFSCGDAAPTYRWLRGTSRENPKPMLLSELPHTEVEIMDGWERDSSCADDYAYRPSGQPSGRTPFFERASWLYPDRAAMAVRRPSTETPVKKALRSAGLVRGEHPYAIIVDDIAADDDEDHRFTWSAHLDPDITIEKVDTRPIEIEAAEGGDKPEPEENAPEPTLMTVTLEPGINRSTPADNPLDANGDPKLVFRLLFLDQQGTMTPETQPRIEVIRVYLKVFRTGVVGRDPKFRVLLVVNRATDRVTPSVVQTATGAYRLKIGKQEDLIDFSTNDSGRTGILLSRQQGEGAGDEFAFGATR